MALADLLAELEHRAAERIETVRAEAETRASAIRDEADAAAQREIDEALRDQREVLAREVGLRIAEARERETRATLEAREALLMRIFRRARNALEPVARSEKGAEALAGQVVPALFFLDGAPCTVRCPDAVAQRLDGRISADRVVRVVVDDQQLGFVIESEDKHLVVDGGLSARLERLRPTLSVALARRLEAEP